MVVKKIYYICYECHAEAAIAHTTSEGADEMPVLSAPFQLTGFKKALNELQRHRIAGFAAVVEWSRMRKRLLAASRRGSNKTRQPQRHRIAGFAAVVEWSRMRKRL